MATNESRRNRDYSFESDLKLNHPLMSWRSTVAGLIIGFFVMAGLTGLGMAFGGIGMDEDTSMTSVGVFTGLWFLFSCVISIFIGSYFAARVSKYQMGRIGSVQGIVIAALFLGAFIWQSLVAFGGFNRPTDSVIGKTFNRINQLRQNPTVFNFVENATEDAVGDLNLKSDPQVVYSGLISRIFRGDIDGAKNYLVIQAAISPEEAGQRITNMKNRFDIGIADAKQKAALALKSSGWSLFLLVALSALAAISGGALGSVVNHRKPLIVKGPYTKEQQA